MHKGPKRELQGLKDENQTASGPEGREPGGHCRRPVTTGCRGAPPSEGATVTGALEH